jgi:hypothetical protein
MKLQILFTLFSALVHSSFATHEYDIYCNLAEETRVADECFDTVPETTTTMDHLIAQALDDCILEVTAEEVAIAGVYYTNSTRRRELRGVNIPPQERVLHTCDYNCCCKEACMVWGYCGSSNSCGSQSCSRRLEPEEEGTVTTERELDLSAKCTEAVQAVATQYGTNCLGSDPSVITCTVTVREHD